ncbi:hypothetical protein [Brasilonema sp. UFV-L1]|uniref:hypothetical protein n=1 Tax=Brasilonema sp. UFV-L1 TaxID=2234130 RepID=UPI00145C626E|nr:hypothetical protein [Brasilonema sp. UFV-L1]NMG11068.1 hypothetical protein [Brasilonema sp. UFV-L1]
MKSQYLIAPLIIGIMTVSANYANTHNLLLLENAPRTVKTIQKNKLQARVPADRGVPTRRESGGARSIKQVELKEIQQHLIAAEK